MSAVVYGMFKIRNPEYRGSFWRKIRALASSSGPMCFPDVLRELLPKMEAEPAGAYESRISQAYSPPYVSRLIGQVVSSLGTDPLSIKTEEGEAPESGAWYHTFSEDVSAPDGQRQTLDQFMMGQARTAFLCGRAWTLVDLPMAEDQPKNLADEQERGLQDAYLCAVEPECVIDWEWDADNDSLVWAVVRSVRSRRASFGDARDTVEESFTLYEEKGWTRFSFVYKVDEPPAEDAAPTSTESGEHSFGEVPLVPFELPDDLRIGQALESTATELFRKANGLSYAENRGLYAQLVEYSDSSMEGLAAKEIGGVPPLEAQVAGPSTVLRAQPGSRLEYLAPPAHVYTTMQEKVVFLRDELYRAVNQIALAANTTGASLGRSAESKGIDLQALNVMLAEVGRHVREHCGRVLCVVSSGRKDGVDPEVDGMREFDLIDRKAMLEEANLVIGKSEKEGVVIQSPTFLAEYSLQVARQLVPSADDEKMLAIRQELERSIASASQTLSGSAPPAGGMDQGADEDDTSGGDPGDQVYEMLAEDFPPEAIDWVKRLDWSGPEEVPLADIDFSNQKSWAAAREPKKVAKFRAKLKRQGWWKPVVLVRKPGGGKWRVVDGHHRVTAAQQLGMAVQAFTAEADGDLLDRALEAHTAQKADPSGPKK